MEDTKTPTPLDLLHKFFDSIRRKDREGTPKRRRDPEHRKARVAAAKAWAEGHNKRAKMVAVCPHCREWFPTTEARNVHRNTTPRTALHA